MAREKDTQTTAQQGQPQSSGQNRQMTTRQPTQQQGLARRADWMPSLWARGGPFAVMQRLAEEMDQLFNTAFSDFGMGRQGRLATSGRNSPSGMQTQWAPPIDVIERGNQLMVRAELPGLNTNDINIEVMDDMLTISGERREEHEENQQGYRVSERRYGHFLRSIPLPEGVEPEQVQAKFQNGVLEVTMPMPKQEQRGRRVEIQGESSKGDQQSGQQARTAS